MFGNAGSPRYKAMIALAGFAGFLGIYVYYVTSLPSRTVQNLEITTL
jgi:hypothetical protein